MFNRAITTFRLAVAFLTRIPGVHPTNATAADFARAQGWFSLIGLLIGAVIAIVELGGLVIGLPPIVAAALAIAAGIMLTGGLHEDGLADVADGLGGGRDRDDKLHIMRDSRIGTYGTLALMIVIIVKVAALAQLTGVTLIAALAVAHATSRSAATAMASLLSPARTDGLGASAGRPSPVVLATSFGVSLVAGLLLVPPLRLIAALTAAVLGTGVMAIVARRQIGGYTGDVLGATQQLAETAILLALIARPIVFR
jgi:adenosylcobinamide-GDP ribazoletransferase